MHRFKTNAQTRAILCSHHVYIGVFSRADLSLVIKRGEQQQGAFQMLIIYLSLPFKLFRIKSQFVYITRTFNECSVESQVPTINSVDTSSRRLKHEMAEMLTFISTNGPHPLASLNVIEDALNRHFKEKQWHFVLSNSQYYTSKVVDRQIKESAGMANELA